MIERFYPDERIASSYVIPYEQLFEEGWRGLIYDIDNTLVPHNAPADDRAVKLFERLRSIGFKTCLLSNNRDARVRPFARLLRTQYICMAWKPAKRGYYKAMESMGTTLANTIFIGDQLFTDVWGAKRIGMRNILVNPINPKEEFQIVLKRRLEKIVLDRYEAEKDKAKRGQAAGNDKKTVENGRDL